MAKDRIQNYNEHAKFLADIALAILNGNKSALDVNGVKEIIALYLLIPYMSEKILDTPGEQYIIPQIKGKFADDISYANLRNTISHSFVTVEEEKNDDTLYGKCLIFDDRLIHNRKEHEQKGNHSEAYSISINHAHKKLLEMVNEIIEF